MVTDVLACRLVMERVLTLRTYVEAGAATTVVVVLLLIAVTLDLGSALPVPSASVST
jgi:hypothetical protein